MTPQATSGSVPVDFTRLIILGAGCSLGYGYPSAKDMVPHLRRFADALTNQSTRLRQFVHKALGTFDRLVEAGAPASTLDDLAWLVHQGKLGTNRSLENESANNRLVETAKVAVAALFLSKEEPAAKSGLAGYRTLMRRILGSEFGTDYRLALKQTPYRVLTFNYDRLFELAYRQHFDVDLTQAFYGPTGLNSGLFQVMPGRIEVDPNRFSFLKLHGSVGVFSDDRYGRCDHVHSIPEPGETPRLSDDQFFFPSNDHLQPNLPNLPLILFPHEKDFLKEYPDNRLPYRVYIPTIWEAARRFATQAEQIEIIGYSCPEPDSPALRSLIEASTKCKRVVVQNPSAKAICQRMRSRLPSHAGLFEAYESTFEDT